MNPLLRRCSGDVHKGAPDIYQGAPYFTGIYAKCNEGGSVEAIANTWKLFFETNKFEDIVPAIVGYCLVQLRI